MSDEGLMSIACYYKGTGNIDNEDAINSMILGNRLLTANGVSVASRKGLLAYDFLDCVDFCDFFSLSFGAVRKTGQINNHGNLLITKSKVRHDFYSISVLFKM